MWASFQLSTYNILISIDKTLPIFYRSFLTLQILHLATDMVDELGRRPAELQGSLLTKTWFRLFLKRWPALRVTAPSKLEMSHAKATTHEALTTYFDELTRILEKYNLKNKPDRIYNVDETNLNADHK